jgi:hypothetical protein
MDSSYSISALDIGGGKCLLCAEIFANVRINCSNNCIIHARCNITWPLMKCPCCSNLASSVSLISCDSNRETISSCSSEGIPQQRGGRWSGEESEYASLVVEAFELGFLPLIQSTKLGGLLCSLLVCLPARLSSKLKIGKKSYQSRTASEYTIAEMARISLLQKQLSV